MAKLPRDLSGRELCRRLERLGYVVQRQKGSHIRLVTELRGLHLLTVVDERPLHIKTLNRILKSVGEHHALSLPELMDRLFD